MTLLLLTSVLAGPPPAPSSAPPDPRAVAVAQTLAGPLAACFSREHRTAAGPAGTMQVRLTRTATGHETEVVEDTTGSERLQACVLLTFAEAELTDLPTESLVVPLTFAAPGVPSDGS